MDAPRCGLSSFVCISVRRRYGKNFAEQKDSRSCQRHALILGSAESTSCHSRLNKLSLHTMRQNIEPSSWLVSCQSLSLIHIKASSIHAWCHLDCPFFLQSIVSNHLRRTDEDESQTYQCTIRPFRFPRSRMTWPKYTLFSINPQHKHYCKTFKKGINRNNALILRSVIDRLCLI